MIGSRTLHNKDLFNVLTKTFSSINTLKLKKLMAEGYEFAGIYSLVLGAGSGWRNSFNFSQFTANGELFRHDSCIIESDLPSKDYDVSEDIYDALTATFSDIAKYSFANLLAHSHQIMGVDIFFLDHIDLRKNGKILAISDDGELNECNRSDYKHTLLDTSITYLNSGIRSDVNQLLTASFDGPSKQQLIKYIDDGMHICGIFSILLDSDESLKNDCFHRMEVGGVVTSCSRQSAIEFNLIKKNYVFKPNLNFDLFRSIKGYYKHKAASRVLSERVYSNKEYIIGAETLLLDSCDLQKQGKIKSLSFHGDTEILDRNDYLEFIFIDAHKKL